MAKATAHRPSQAHLKYVKNSKGEKVQNTAYKKDSGSSKTKLPPNVRKVTEDEKLVGEVSSRLTGLSAITDRATTPEEISYLDWQAKYTKAVSMRNNLIDDNPEYKAKDRSIRTEVCTTGVMAFVKKQEGAYSPASSPADTEDFVSTMNSAISAINDQENHGEKVSPVIKGRLKVAALWADKNIEYREIPTRGLRPRLKNHQNPFKNGYL